MRFAVVNVRSTSGGGFTVLRDFSKFAESHPEHQWLFVVAVAGIRAKQHLQVVKMPVTSGKPVRRLWWEVYSLPRIVQDFSPDAVLSMQNMPIPFVRSPQYVYLHQSLPFQDDMKFSLLKSNERSLAIRQKLLGLTIKRGLPNARRVFVQTEWMRNEVSKTGAIVENIGYDLDTSQSELIGSNSPGHLRSRRFFYPASAMPYKNFWCLHEARNRVAQHDADFSIDLTMTREELVRLVGARDSELKHYRFLGKISREEVYSLYKNCILLFPSRLESLGLPLLEAALANAYVIAADLPYAKESLRGYPNVAYFNPNSPSELSSLMLSAMSGEVTIHPGPARTERPEDHSWSTILSAMEECG